MIYFTDALLDSLIKEDVPYIDLTSTVLEIGDKKGIIEFRVRENGVVACTEEASKILQKLDVSVRQCVASGTFVSESTVILSGEGKAQALHMAWKVCLNILEYCCGIATHAKKLVDKVNRIDSNIAVVATRKSFPGTKELIMKAALAGGVLPHRLGLSETVLIFKQHLCFLDEVKSFAGMIPVLKRKCHEKKIIVEVESIEEARELAILGVDGIQFDKVSCEDLTEYVKMMRKINAHITLIAAGGININNIEQYAGTGVDVIATSSLFHGKPLDIGAKMNMDRTGQVG